MASIKVTDYQVTLVRDSSSRYMIGSESYGIGSDASHIPERVRFDLREAGINAGRQHFEHVGKLPGQITVRKVGRKVEVEVD